MRLRRRTSSDGCHRTRPRRSSVTDPSVTMALTVGGPGAPVPAVRPGPGAGEVVPGRRPGFWRLRRERGPRVPPVPVPAPARRLRAAPRAPRRVGARPRRRALPARRRPRRPRAGAERARAGPAAGRPPGPRGHQRHLRHAAAPDAADRGAAGGPARHRAAGGARPAGGPPRRVGGRGLPPPRRRGPPHRAADVRRGAVGRHPRRRAHRGVRGPGPGRDHPHRRPPPRRDGRRRVPRGRHRPGAGHGGPHDGVRVHRLGQRRHLPPRRQRRPLDHPPLQRHRPPGPGAHHRAAAADLSGAGRRGRGSSADCAKLRSAQIACCGPVRSPNRRGPHVDADTTPAPLTHRQVLVVFSGIMLGMFLAAIDQTIVATALPTIAGELGGLSHLSWVVTAYLLAEAVATPLYGKLGDLYGRKRVFQSAIVLFLAGSVLCGLSASMGQLVAFRAIQGAGAGGIIVGAQALIADIVSPRERGRYQGYFGAVFGLSSVAGPLIGGFLTEHASWRWVFYVNLPIGLVALVVTSIVLPASIRRERVRIDWLGTTVLSAAIVCLVLVTTWGGNEHAWGSPLIVGLSAAAVVLGVVFVLVERRVEEPAIPLRLFRNRTFNIASAVSLIIGAGMFGAISYLPAFLQIGGGVSESNSGLLLVPVMAGLLMSSIAAGRRVSRTGRYRHFPIAGMAVAA